MALAALRRGDSAPSALAGMAGVNAATDVTGFGLLGHLSEMASGSGLRGVIERGRVPVFDAARRLAGEGVKTGASGRNWSAVSGQVADAEALDDLHRTLLCDPQTSGGLLVSCTPEAADGVLALFREHGHGDAAIVGRMEEGAGVGVD